MAQDFLRRVAGLAEDLKSAHGDGRADVYARMGDAYREGGKHVKALVCYQQAWDLGSREAGLARAYADELGTAGRNPEALGILTAIPPSQLSPSDRGRLLLAECRILWRSARYDEAEARAGQARQLLEHPGADRADLGEAWNISGIILIEGGKPAGAKTNFRRARELFIEAGHLHDQVRAENNLGLTELTLGEYPAAMKWFSGALTIASEEGFEDMVATIRGNLALIHENRGELEEARRLQESCLRTFVARGDYVRQLWVQLNLAAIAVLQGDWSTVRVQGGRTLERFRQLGDDRHEASALLHLAAANVADGDVRSAREKADRALAIADSKDYREPRVRALRFLGELDASAGAAGTSCAQLERSVSGASSAGLVFEEAVGRLVLGRLQMAAGDQEVAASNLSAARAAFVRMDAGAWIDRVDQIHR